MPPCSATSSGSIRCNDKVRWTQPYSIGLVPTLTNRASFLAGLSSGGLLSTRRSHRYAKESQKRLVISQRHGCSPLTSIRNATSRSMTRCLPSAPKSALSFNSARARQHDTCNPRVDRPTSRRQGAVQPALWPVFSTASCRSPCEQRQASPLGRTLFVSSSVQPIRHERTHSSWIREFGSVSYGHQVPGRSLNKGNDANKPGHASSCRVRRQRCGATTCNP